MSMVTLGKPYLFTDDSGETMHSASRLLKQQWLDAGTGRR